MQHKTEVLVLLSGGLDSTACIGYYKKLGYSTIGLFVDYGQNASKEEYKAATAVSKYYDIELFTAKCSGLNKYGIGLIPGRNTLLLSVALMSGKISKGIICIGIHSGTSYYDCSLSYLKNLNEIFKNDTDGKITIGAPFIEWNKREIWDFCLASDVPVNLTYSCERGSEIPCGECLSCSDMEVLYATCKK